MSERHACPACGLAAPRDARFCAECGTRLDAAPSEELRKLVTILFCELVDSMQFER